MLGFDAIDDARKAIKDGRMEATVAQFPREMGKQAIESAVKALRGEAVPPEIGVRIGLVTAKNVEETGAK